jgi:hypothetical protein
VFYGVVSADRVLRESGVSGCVKVGLAVA